MEHREPAEDRPVSSVLVQVKRPRIEFCREAHDLLFPLRFARTSTQEA